MFPPGDMDFGRLLRQSQERMQKLAAIQEQTAELTGRAETPDGRIKVASTAGDPLAELQIDPRAMRMPAEDLAAAIRDTVRLARRDLEERVERITSEQYGEEDNPLNALGNSEELQRNLNDMQSMFQRTGQDAQTMLEDLQRKLGLRSDRD